MTQAQALLLSIGLEVPCLLLAARLLRWSDDSLLRLTAIGAAATLLTHPFVWHGSRALSSLIADGWTRLAITEIGAWLAEALLYAKLIPLSRPQALAISLLANTISFGAGLIWVLWLR